MATAALVHLTKQQNERYLHYISHNNDGISSGKWLSRDWVAAAATYAVKSLQKFLNTDSLFGIRIVHNMTKNALEDIVLRKAAMFSGFVPVTINWQADSLEKIAYKAACTDSPLVICDEDFDKTSFEKLKHMVSPTTKVVFSKELFVLKFDAAFMAAYTPPIIERENVGETEQMINFTSGTTADPKGAITSYRNYDASQNAYKSLMKMDDSTYLVYVLVNPLHHMNSTCFLRWALVNPNCEVHIFDRYSSAYWLHVQLLLEEVQQMCISQNRDYRVVMPVVSKHIEFLNNLSLKNALPKGISLKRLQEAMAPRNVVVAMGSAPVPESTIYQFQSLFNGKLPLIRFGSTESALQVCATPWEMPAEELMRCFKIGWNYTINGELQKANYIGRDHSPHTFVRIIKSLNRLDKNYMVDCGPGEPGYIVYKGKSGMIGYVNSDILPFSDDGWYLGFGDIGFYLINTENAERKPNIDLYWQSRDSEMLIIGGANYSYAQINDEVKDFIVRRYGIDKADVQIAAVGVHLTNEYDDDCCITIELASTVDKAKANDLKATFLSAIKKDKNACPSCKPKYVDFGVIPRTFKGSIEYKRLAAHFKAFKQPSKY